MKKNTLGTIYIMIAVFVWGLSFVSIKIALQAVEPMTMGLIRFVFATAIMYVFCRLKGVSLKLRREDLPYFLVAGLIGITAYFYFENTGVKYTNASVSSLIIASIPVFAVIAESVFYKTRITKKVAMSLFLSVTGVCMIVGVNIEELKASGYLLGYLMMLGAAVTWIVYSLSSKPLFERYGSPEITFYQFLIGMIGFIPFVFTENNHFERMTPVIAMNLAFLGIFASSLGFYTYLKSLDILGISKSSLFLNLIPVIAVVFGFAVLGEQITALQMAGGAVVIASVYMVNT